MNVNDLATGWFVVALLGPYAGWQAGCGLGHVLYWTYKATRAKRRMMWNVKP